METPFIQKERKEKKKKSVYYIANIVLLSILGIIILGYISYLANGDLIKKTLLKETLPVIDKYFSTNYSSRYYNDSYNKDNFSSSTTDTITENTNISTTTSIIKIEEIKQNIIKETGMYVKIIDSCSEHFGGSCVRARSCPSISCPVIASVRNNIVLKTDGEIINSDGIDWYHIVFDEWVRYPERTAKEWYISSEFLEIIESEKSKYAKGYSTKNETNKEIIIKTSEQKLYAYENDEIFMEINISTGLDDLPTPKGTFSIFEKTPSRYMQGPLPGISDDEYDLPGVPWTMYFTAQGAAIHGAYWHDNFGSQWSHGCVNLSPGEAEKLYNWAELGTKVIVKY